MFAPRADEQTTTEHCDRHRDVLGGDGVVGRAVGDDGTPAAAERGDDAEDASASRAGRRVSS